MSEPQFEIEMNEDTFIQLKKIYSKNNWMIIKPGGRARKVMRRIINFFESEAELIQF